MATETTPPLSSALLRLGTETAYKVSLEAGQLAATGKKIYPFHIGDLNFRTPQCVVDACKKALDAGKTGYCPAAGVPELRKAVADYFKKTRGLNYGVDNVVVQPGGKPIIEKMFLSVLEPGDEVLYPSPGYPIYESCAEFFGGVAKPYSYIETKTGFEMNMEHLKSLITPKTKILVYNNYHNPMGIASSPQEMQQIADLCIKHNLWCLSDEPYFEISFSDQPPVSIATLPGMKDRTVILFTFSKAWAMTGWRLGASLSPVNIALAIAKHNTNQEACTTHFVQYAGVTALTHPDALGFTKNMLKTLRERRDVLVPMVNKVPGMHCFLPTSTFYLFVNVTKAMKILGLDDLEAFRKTILSQTGVSFCTRAHFGRPLANEPHRYVRFAYSGINVDQIREGLTVLRKFMECAAKKKCCKSSCKKMQCKL